MGRLTLNVLLSFAQFEREVIGERVRDKIAASKRKGLWVGGPVPLGYRCLDGGGGPHHLQPLCRARPTEHPDQSEWPP
jgi:DNA invertase Pin-like site-specific DNA recombinase